MKFIVAVLLTALLSFVAGLWLDWWSLAIASFLVALLVHQRAWKAFASGFLGLFLLWAVLAAWADSNNHGILSSKMATLLPLGGSSFLLILVTGLVAALVAGFASLSASYLRSRRA